MFGVGRNLPVPKGERKEQVDRWACELHRCYSRVWRAKSTKRTYVLQCGWILAIKT
jgi:hypothetical protein